MLSLIPTLHRTLSSPTQNGHSLANTPTSDTSRATGKHRNENREIREVRDQMSVESVVRPEVRAE